MNTIETRRSEEPNAPQTLAGSAIAASPTRTEHVSWSDQHVQVTRDTPRDAQGIAQRVALKRASTSVLREHTPFVPEPPRLTGERLREVVERTTRPSAPPPRERPAGIVASSMKAARKVRADRRPETTPRPPAPTVDLETTRPMLSESHAQAAARYAEWAAKAKDQACICIQAMDEAGAAAHFERARSLMRLANKHLGWAEAARPSTGDAPATPPGAPRHRERFRFGFPIR